MACRRCGTELRPGSGELYQVVIEAVADPAPPRLAGEESTTDLRQQIEQILGRLQDVSERELLEQVYRRLTFCLCGPCYRHWIKNPVG
jgi:hypothetical protein